MKGVKRFNLFLMLALLAGWTAVGGAQAAAPLVNLGTLGSVAGSYEDISLPDGNVKTVQMFSAIPYAEPMTPENRWKASVKKKPFKDNPYDASGICPACPQFSYEKDIREDCLYLRIATPERAKPGANLPVMVFIHGGAFETGSANSGYYNGGAAIVAQKDVIVVTINYRLGILGFMVHHGQGANDTSSGNFGLGDQKLAIEFVRDHIGAFGGDAGNITIFGESAGAMSIGFHLMMEDQNYFDAAIMQSNLFGLPNLTEAQGATLGKKALDQMGCQDLDCMRRKKTEDLLTTAQALAAPAVTDFGLKGIFCFKPVIEDKTFGFKTQPMNHTPEKPVILGINENEGPMIVLGVKSTLESALGIKNLERMTEAQFNQVLHLLFKDENAEKIFEPAKNLFPAFMKESQCRFMNSPTKYYTLLSRIFTDFLFTSANIKYAYDAAGSGTPLYAYHFTHVSSCDFWPAVKPQCTECVCHTEDLPYVFGTFAGFNPVCTAPDNYSHLQPAEYALSHRIMTYWTQFAKMRNPGASWPVFDNLPYTAQFLDIQIDSVPVKAASLAADAFYQLYLPVLESENL